MGLDMYLNGKKFLLSNWDHPEKDEREDGFKVKEKTLELGYWRKHPNLHGYIVQTFAEGKDDCQDIPLTKENIETILKAIEAKELPETTGFFFGKSDGFEHDEDIKIFTGALKWLEGEKNNPNGKQEFRDVVYRASW